MRTRAAMLEIQVSWLPRNLEGADVLFWPANVCLFILPGLRASFCCWVRGLTLFMCSAAGNRSSLGRLQRWVPATSTPDQTSTDQPAGLTDFANSFAPCTVTTLTLASSFAHLD